MPIQDNEIIDSINKAKDLLNDIAKKISDITFPKLEHFNFELNKLSDVYINTILNDIPAGYAKGFEETDFIYIFKLLDVDNDKKTLIKNALESSRKLQELESFKGKKDFCRLNETLSDYLYVGRSQHLRSRLKQHLSGCDEGIFAMHMLRWSAGLDCKIEVNYYRFDNYENIIIQALEDGLSQSFSPMFGRKGEK